MIEIITLGLSVLSSMTGVRSSMNYLEPNLNTSFSGDTVLKIKQKKDTVYSIDGANRYIVYRCGSEYQMIDLKDGGIENTRNKDEYPYKNLDHNYMKIYSSKDDSKYLYFDGKNIKECTNNAIIESFSIESIKETGDEAGGYTFINSLPKNVSKIDNSFYFEKLHNKHGTNTKNSCSIVAMQILLGYYDTFKNDRLVAERFDVCVKENISGTDIKKFNYSLGTDSSTTNNYFHDYLVKLGKEITNDDAEDGNGFSVGNSIKLMKSYSAISGVNYDMTCCEGNLADSMSGANMRFIKERINNDRPVVKFGSQHATVAFAYDEKYVYVHTGWGRIAKTVWGTYDDYFQNVEYPICEFGAIDLNISSSHIHSNNYYSIALEKYLCPCGYVLEGWTKWKKYIFCQHLIFLLYL